MDHRVRGILGNHLPGELGVVDVSRIQDLGFKPCPFCGKYNSMQLMPEEDYEAIKAHSDRGTSCVRVSCDACGIDMYDMDLYAVEPERNYQAGVARVMAKWNKRANESL